MILIKSAGRLTPQQLMSRVLISNDEGDHYGLSCDGKEESGVPAEPRDLEFEDCSNSEGSTAPYSYKICPADHFRIFDTDLSDGEASGKKALDPAVLEKHIYNAARAQDVKTL